MRLTVLGSGTAAPVAHRGPTAHWLRAGDTSLLIDCGSGALQKLYRAGGDLAALDGVLLTHAHIDHIGDLPTVLFALRAGIDRAEPLRLYHRKELAPYLDGLGRVFGDWLGRPGQVERVPLALGAQRSLGDVELATFEVLHHPTSLGLLFTEPATGATLAIPSDTGLCQTLTEAVAGVDTLVIECAATDDAPRDGHMNPSDLVHLIGETRPGAVVITHQYPEVEEAGAVGTIAAQVACRVIGAQDGLEVEIAAGRVAVEGDRSAGAGLGQAATLERRAAASTRLDAYPDEAPRVSRSGGVGDEQAAMRALMEAELEALDADDWRRHKYDLDVRETQRRSTPQRPVATRLTRRWSAEAVDGIRTSRAHRRLLKRAASHEPLPEVNLRGLTRDEALSRLSAAVQTWASRGDRFGRIVTGKGRRSERSPVLKVVALDWLDGLEGTRIVAEWAPEITRDGRFGTVVAALR